MHLILYIFLFSILALTLLFQGYIYILFYIFSLYFLVYVIIFFMNLHLHLILLCNDYYKVFDLFRFLKKLLSLVAKTKKPLLGIKSASQV